MTPLKAHRFARYLRFFGILDEYSDVIDGLMNGFSLHCSLTISESLILPHHRSAIDHPEVIEKLITKELTAGRYVGPFDRASLESIIGPFRSHPLGVIEKSKPGEFRVIEDLSAPRDQPLLSVNATSIHDDIEVSWGTFVDALRLVITAKPGAQGATFDWKDAYRAIPIAPDDYNKGIVEWLGQFLVDLASKFGHTRSLTNFSRPCEAFIAIASRMSLGEFLKWVDDLFNRREPICDSPPYIYAYDMSDICNLATELGIPFSLSKVTQFSDTTRYLGFDFHWSGKRVSIPSEKCAKAQAKVVTLLASGSASIKELDSICGTLSHLSNVVLLGRSNLRGLWGQRASMATTGANDFAKWPIRSAAKKNLEWWSSSLGNAPIFLDLCPQISPDPSITVYTDASSSWGIGVVINEVHDRFRLTDGWQRDGKPDSEPARDIGWAEFAAVELAVHALVKSFGYAHRFFRILCDNQGVVGAWNSRSSRNVDQNEVLGRTMSLLLSHRCFMVLEYVPSSCNLADGPSRGLPLPSHPRTTFQGFPSNLRGLMFRA